LSAAGDGDSPLLGPDGQPIRSTRGGGGGGDDGDDAAHALPEPTLTVHVFQLASQVAMALGEVEHPLSGRRETDLRAAHFLIDTIAMLEEKTRGNRTPEEDEYLSGVLGNLRMAYVSKSG
jgi:hypothetical protein